MSFWLYNFSICCMTTQWTVCLLLYRETIIAGCEYIVRCALKQTLVSYLFFDKLKWKWKVKSESDIRQSMVTHTRNLCSAFNPSKVHTHTAVNTHPEQWAAIYASAPGEQLGVRCLAQGHLSHGIEGGESAVHSLPHLQSLLNLRLELTTFGLRVRLSNH